MTLGQPYRGVKEWEAEVLQGEAEPPEMEVGENSAARPSARVWGEGGAGGRVGRGDARRAPRASLGKGRWEPLKRRGNMSCASEGTHGCHGAVWKRDRLYAVGRPSRRPQDET